MLLRHRQAADAGEFRPFALHPPDNVAVARVPIPGGDRAVGRGPATGNARGHSRGPTRSRSEPSGQASSSSGTGPGHRARQPVDRSRGSTCILTTSPSKSCNFDYDFRRSRAPAARTEEGCPTFLGYQRADGRVGTRNYIAVVAASNCAAHTAEIIARAMRAKRCRQRGCCGAFPHGARLRPTALGDDVDQLRRTVAGVLAHPNSVAGIILSGCSISVWRR